MKETKSKKSVYSKFDDERSVAMSIIPKSDRKMKTRKLFMILLYIAYVGIWCVIRHSGAANDRGDLWRVHCGVARHPDLLNVAVCEDRI